MSHLHGFFLHFRRVQQELRYRLSKKTNIQSLFFGMTGITPAFLPDGREIAVKTPVMLCSGKTHNASRDLFCIFIRLSPVKPAET